MPETIPSVDDWLRSPLGRFVAGLRLPDGDVDASAALLAAGLGDGHPVLAPTPDRVGAFLEAAPAVRYRGGPLPLTGIAPTVAEIAAVCVLTGCPPSALPLVVAGLAAATDPAFNLLGCQTTTSAVTPTVVVSGSAVEPLLGDDGEPSRPVCAAVARAVGLSITALGNVLPGVPSAATLPPDPPVLFAEPPGNPWGDAGAAVTLVPQSGRTEVLLEGSPDTDVRRFTVASAHLAYAMGRGRVSARLVALVPPEVAGRLAGAGMGRPEFRDAVLTGWQALDDQFPQENGTAPPPADLRPVVTGRLGVKGALLLPWPAAEPVTVTLG